MRVIKMFGLAAIAAIAAMAFMGASSAMATSTALCTEDSAGATCPSGKLASHVHFETPATEPAKLLNTLLTVECTALFLGDVSSTNLLGAPLVIKGHLTYSGCNGGCVVKEVSKEATIEALKEGTELAKITGKGEVEVFCLNVLECTYNGTNLVGHGLGPLVTGDNGHVTFTKTAVTKTGGPLCPTSAELDALFVALPNPLYIRE